MSAVLVQHFFRMSLRGKRKWGALIAVMAPAFFAFMAAKNSPSGLFRREAFLGVAFETVMIFLGLAVLVVATATFRDDRDSGTFPFVFMNPSSVTGFAASAMLGGCLASVAVAAAGWAAMAGVSVVLLQSSDYVFPLLALYTAGAVGYSLPFIPLGYLLSRPFTIGLFYIFVWEGMLASSLSGLRGVSIWRRSFVVLAELADISPISGKIGRLPTSIGGWLFGTVVLAVIAGAILVWAFSERDAL